MHAPIIGIDCATDPKKVGLARLMWAEDASCLTVAGPVSERDALVVQIVAWMEEGDATLLALDAPLGWPQPLIAGLALHRAGESLVGDPAELFNRMTDRFIHRVIGKKPLDVGADRIARTAVAALGLLQAIRTKTGQTIPLAWQPGTFASTAAIEVYPAGTLKVLDLPFTRYKRRNLEETAVRCQIIEHLRTMFQFDEPSTAAMKASGDCLDAALCCLAGLDFLAGNVLPPPDAIPDLEIEGWIWVRPPVS